MEEPKEIVSILDYITDDGVQYVLDLLELEALDAKEKQAIELILKNRKELFKAEAMLTIMLNRGVDKWEGFDGAVTEYIEWENTVGL